MRYSCARLPMVQDDLGDDGEDRHARGRRTGSAPAVLALIAFSILLGGCNLGGTEYSPNDCELSAHYPHPSGHAVPKYTRINATSDITCGTGLPVTQLSIKNQLWRHRWWGWQKIGAPGSDSNFGRSFIESHANDECGGTFNYRQTAQGSSIEHGRTYRARGVTSMARRIEEKSDGRCAFVE